ncbi:MAG: response regulator transcription factor [Armatimonadetes bacterium]|nr:response regulator transcription factor [Armatimonadota bacterium]
MHVLIVEDDKKLASFLRRALSEKGHVCEVAADGAEGLKAWQSGSFDLVVLDWMLPRLDGLEVLRRARAVGLRTPVLVLTAREAVDDRVLALDAGADDYLVKPFALEELLARVRALGRRPPVYQEKQLRVGDLELDAATRTARRAGHVIELTAREYQLLELLMRHAGQVLTHTAIAEQVWGYAFDPSSNVVQVYVSYLRRKLELPDQPPLIQTIRGVGYTLVPPSQAD